MSEKSQSISNESAKPPAKKRAVKKPAGDAAAAVKTTAKKTAAKKAATTKTAAKKTATTKTATSPRKTKTAELAAPAPASEVVSKARVVRKKKAEATTAAMDAKPMVAAPSVPPTPPEPVVVKTTPAPPPSPVAPAPSMVAPPQQAVTRQSQNPPPQQQNFQRPQNDFRNKNNFNNGKKNRPDHNAKQKNRPFGKGPAMAKPDADAEREAAVLTGPRVDVEGLLEISPKGSGFLRNLKKNLEQARDDVFVGSQLINRFGLRPGVVLKAVAQSGPRGLQVVEINSVNDGLPDEARRQPHFEELKAINPTKRIPFENDQNRFTTRVLDIVAPVGRGQRGLIVSPPRSGKTTLLLHIAESVRNREDDNLHLIVLLVDERPEEVTEFKRALPGTEIFASSNDEHPRNHCRIAELTIERAKRLVESGKHVFLLMDSITRLARAYNNNGQQQGRGIGSGGVMVGALDAPRRLFAAARNTRGGGSLTILATALIQTNSRADEAIFQEFKGTGNMEIVLDRKIAENYIYPAVDIFKSGTRREELLLPEHMLHKIHLIRRGLSGHKPLEAMERLTYFLKKFPSNAQMLLEIKG
jgi:transcription termination factor Rho